MTNQKELRKLRHWIHENVFGWTPEKEAIFPNRNGWVKDGYFCVQGDEPDYPADPAAALAVLEKCAEKLDSFNVCIWKGTHGSWFCGEQKNAKDVTMFQKSKTLPLAIAKFAKALFSK